MQNHLMRGLLALGVALATLAGCGGGSDAAAPVTSIRYAADSNLPDAPLLPQNSQVCATLEASSSLVKNSDGSLPASADPTPATFGGATTALNNPDQARIQAALDACGAGVDAQVGALISQLDSAAAATQTANIGGASAEKLSAYKATQFVVRLVKNSGGAGNAFLSGPLVLPSGVTLWVDDGVTLFAARDVVLYDKVAKDRPNAITCGAAINNPNGLPAPAGTVNAGQATLAGISGMQNCYPFIRGNNTVNSAIVGTGSIDGRGYMPLITSSPLYPIIRWATGVVATGITGATENMTLTAGVPTGVSKPKFSCTNTIAAYRAGQLAPEGTACDVVTAMGSSTLTTPGVIYIVNRQATSVPNGMSITSPGCTSSTTGCARWVTSSWWDISYHGNKDIGGGPYSYQGNFGMLWMQYSKGLTLYQITLRNSPFFTVETDGVDGLTVWGIKIITPRLPDPVNQAGVGMNNDAFDGASGVYTHLYTGNTIDASSTGVKNTDGVDPSVASGPAFANLTTGSTTASSGSVHFDGYVKNVAIVYNYLSPSDDNVAFKGGMSDPRPGGFASNGVVWGIDGNRDVSSNRTYGIVVAHNHSYNGHGLSIGSPTNAGVRNINFYDNYFDSVYDGSTASTDMGVIGLRIKSGQARGGDVSNITYDGACLRGGKDFLVFDMYYTAPSADPLSYTGLGWLIPSFHDITMSNVRMMNIPANKTASKTGAGNLTFRGLNADAGFANTQSIIKLSLDNVVVDKDVNVSTANLSKLLNPPSSGVTDGSMASKIANANLTLGSNVSLLGSAFVHGTGGLLTNTSTGVAKNASKLYVTVTGSDDAGAASDPNPAATIVAGNPKLSICDNPASWPAFPDVK